MTNAGTWHGVLAMLCALFVIMALTEHLLMVGSCQLTSTQNSCSLVSVTVLED